MFYKHNEYILYKKKVVVRNLVNNAILRQKSCLKRVVYREALLQTGSVLPNSVLYKPGLLGVIWGYVQVQKSANRVKKKFCLPCLSRTFVFKAL